MQPFEGLWANSIPDGRSCWQPNSRRIRGFPSRPILRRHPIDDCHVAVRSSRVRGIVPADIARSISRLWRSQEVVGPNVACTAAAKTVYWQEGIGASAERRSSKPGMGPLCEPLPSDWLLALALTSYPAVVADVSRIHPPGSAKHRQSWRCCLGRSSLECPPRCKGR